MRPTNLAFLRIAKRAERQDDDVLQRTFVDFGAVFTALSSLDHQIIFGRRGAGKTHLLTFLRQSRRKEGEIAMQLDMRNLGSAGGIYADASIPLPQRATRLLVDLLAGIHGGLFEQAIEHDSLVNLGTAGSALDEFFLAHTTVKVVGTTTVEAASAAENATNAEANLGLAATLGKPGLSGSAGTSTAEKESVSVKKTVTGVEVPRLNFGGVGTALRKIVETLPNKKLWLLIDEWSVVPLDLQPYVADLISRAILPIKGVTVKIAAIEQRTQLLIPETSVGNIGIELGADVAAAINLDDLMVFDNDEGAAVRFFKSLVLKHVQAALEAEGIAQPKDEVDLLSMGFTQGNAFEEVVRACEGVPRDAIHILSHAAQRANDSAISMNDIRIAAKQWYQASKDPAVGAHAQAKALLLWIVDEVIKERQTKAFLLEVGTRDKLIDFLYDERVLHVLRKGMSAKDAPGQRFNVYGIDYGCYVDMINTAKAPKGMLDLGDDGPDYCVAVPKTDFRSIRRCILNLPDFYSKTEDPAA